MAQDYVVLVMSRHHLNHLLPLHALITDVNSGPSASLIVTDTFGHLSCLQLLEAVAVRTEPLINLLWTKESMPPKLCNNDLITFRNNHNVLRSTLPPCTYISQVKDKAVSLVEAVPADRHLGCPHSAATLDLEKSLDNHLVRDNMLEPRGHAAFLRK